MVIALASNQSFREICEWWEPEDAMTAMEILDDWHDAMKDAQAQGGG